MTAFHFIRPGWLWLLIPLAFLAWRLYQIHAVAGSWTKACDAHLLPFLLATQQTRSQYTQALIYGLTGAIAIIALAGPTWEQLPVPAYQNQDALVIAFDLSRSMDASDLKPNRLERARYKVDDLLNMRKDGQTALVVFAGDAFTVTPLTDDTETIRYQLGALATDLMPVQGSHAETGITQAQRLLTQAGIVHGQVLLITDGIYPDQAKSAAETLKQAGHQLSVLAVGTKDGAPIKLDQGGFLKDANGNIIIPGVKIDELKQLADVGGGRFHSLTPDNQDLNWLFPNEAPRNAEAKNTEQTEGLTQWVERGAWLLILVLLPSLLVFRRGVLLLAAALFFPVPDLQADETQSKSPAFWQTPDQRGQKAFEQQQYGEASKLYENSSWRAAAQYRAGDYKQAAETLKGLETPDALYNRGNALQQLSQYEEAIQDYDKALELDPNNEDARYNREIAKRKLQQQQQQQQQQQESQNENNQNQDDKESDQQQDSSSSDQKQEQSSNENQQTNKQDQSQSEQQQDKENQGSKNEQPSDPEEQDSQSDNPTDEQQANSKQPEQENDSGPQDDSKSENQDTPEQSEEQEEGTPPSTAEDRQNDENQQANRQWLQRIPDDPGGLLRRKFRYQYQRLNRPQRQDTEAW